MVWLCINYGMAFKTLQMYIGATCYPDNFFIHLQCSRMPAKVYYELSRRFGTRNVLTRTQGWIYGGCTPLALARGGAGGAIFHDKANNY